MVESNFSLKLGVLCDPNLPWYQTGTRMRLFHLVGRASNCDRALVRLRFESQRLRKAYPQLEAETTLRISFCGVAHPWGRITVLRVEREAVRNSARSLASLKKKPMRHSHQRFHQSFIRSRARGRVACLSLAVAVAGSRAAACGWRTSGTLAERNRGQ
jgi:hypothetical protein